MRRTTPEEVGCYASLAVWVLPETKFSAHGVAYSASGSINTCMHGFTPEATPLSPGVRRGTRNVFFRASDVRPHREVLIKCTQLLTSPDSLVCSEVRLDIFYPQSTSKFESSFGSMGEDGMLIRASVHQFLWQGRHNIVWSMLYI
jgi:hypothetical protein